MGAKVFANGLEISGKASDNKTIAAMPDVCLSPPSPPAGPIPIPYPNFAQASDTTDGSKNVKIGGKEVGLKGKSCYKKSKGDEAATRNFGASVVSHVIQGAVKHQAGSFNVKIEGNNVVRFGDITTGNHNNPGIPPGPDIGSPSPASAPDPDCESLHSENEKDRKKFENNQALSGSGTTNTNFKFESQTPGVSSRSNAAHSRVIAVGLSEKHIEGTPAQDRLKAKNPEGKSNVSCPEGESFRYNNCFFKGGHTEARIIETLASEVSKGAKLAGSLTMKIDWQPSGGGESCAPCEHCHALLCAAAKCGLDIYLCTKDNKKVPLNKDKDCEKDLNMNDDKVRARMKIKNTLLKRKLGE